MTTVKHRRAPWYLRLIGTDPGPRWYRLSVYAVTAVSYCAIGFLFYVAASR